MGRKISAVCLTALLLAFFLITVSAAEFDPGKTGSISVTLTEQYDKLPIAGAELSLYLVASVGINTDGQLNYLYTEAFAGSGISLEDPDLAEKLDAWLSHGEGGISLRTDKNGTASCEALPLGLYFIRQTNTVEGFAPCTPFLVTLPMEQEGGYVYAVNATPKTEVAKLTQITVKKVWNTDASTKATDSVTVQLLRGDKVVETAVLNESNNWQITYADLPESDAYRIKEVNVPKGFTATYQKRGYVFTVTNTSTLIQTGQLIWPIPVLAFAGVLLIAAGTVLLQKKRKQDA